MTTKHSPRTRKSALALAAALALGAAPTQDSLAAACTFTPGSGNWNVAGNWSCGVVPSGPPNDSATIVAGRTVVVDTTQSIRQMSNAGTININAFLLDLQSGTGTINTGTINVGSATSAALQIGAGHNITNTGGLINIANGSVANQFGSTITGGTITTTGTGKLVASNNTNNVLDGVTLNGNLDMANGTGVERIVNGLTLNGAVNINNNSVLSFGGNQTLSGNGTIVLGDTGSSNRALSLQGDTALTIGSNIVVRGQNGTIGQAYLTGGTQSIVNNGRISADVAGGTISLEPSGGITNNGVLEARNGGTLVLNSAVTGNVGSSINAAAGSTVVQNGVALSGVINTTGTGTFRAANTNNNFLNGVTLNGNLDLASTTGVERVTGGLVLNGAININNNSVLSFGGDQTLSGTGTIVLGDTGSSNRALSLQGDTVLTIGSNIVVRGQNGTIGQAYLTGGTQSIVNNGRISADVAGGTISLEPSGGITNNGVLEARNGGTLVLNSAVTGNVGSSINAAAGSTVVQNGVALSGVINTTGTGTFRAANTNNNFLNGVTLNGNLDLASTTGVERVTGGLVLNGAININNNSVLSFGGDQTLSGTGTIVLGNTGSSNRALSLQGDTALTIGSNIVVRGQNGTIGQAYLTGGTQSIVNNGRISADVLGGTISLAPSHGITNNGVLEAQNGGTLVLNGNVAGTASGSIVAGTGSTVLQNGVALSGVINTTGSGSFRAANTTANVLNGVTFNGNLDLASATSVERVTGGLVLNGAISVNNNSVLSFGGNQSLTGTGTIVLGNTGSSNRALSLQGDTVLTVGSGITVRGENGTVGQAFLSGGTQQITNNGNIVADVGGGTISLVTGLTVNNALLGAANGGTLRLDGAVTQAGAGQINAATGSTVIQNGVTITGGVLNTVGTGRVAVTASNANFLSGVTVNGLLDLASGTGVERVTGGLTLGGAGTVSVNNNSVLSFSGTQTLGGTGSIVLGNTGSSNRALSLEGDTTLTVASGVTVRGINGTLGQAYLAGGNQRIINNGTINSDGGGTINLGPSTGLTNNGTLRAQSGTLNVTTNVTGTGALRVDPTGSLNLANGGNTQGTLLMGASGSALNVGTGNLTINTDYTNVQAGSGNAFNRRAGVTGTGQIQAGGDVQQVITGANVTGGNTANATLTIGNVRVGANHFDYTIGAGGTTGPTLRGAVQTSVNGANLTDARLSGSGVTASNYNAGAPAGSGETRTVTFVASGAGALAPMSGQVLNLHSTYDNIADQKLNIVMASGAAAYNAAVGSTVNPVQVANQRVNGTSTAVLNISNTASPGNFSEDLDATIASTGGQATASGSVSGRRAGTSNTGTGAITVGVDSTSAGAKTGVVNLNYASTGTVNGVSNGLAAIGVGGQTVTVNGNVYQAASGAIQTGALNFGTVQVGQSVSQSLVIRNTATGAAGFVEDLNASFGAATGTGAGLISGTGSLNGILAGTNSNAGNGSMVVNVNTSAAGVVNGSIAVNYFSAGAVAGVSNGLGTLAVGSQAYGVAGAIQATANVVNQASPLVNTPNINLGAVRVGAASPTATVSVTNQATVAPQAALNASIASNGAPVTASGSFNLLNPGATSNALQVGLNTAVAGNYTGANAGSATIAFVSDASNVGNCAPNCQLTLAPQTVTVSGKVYTAAVGQLGTPVVDFGIVRVGDTVSARNITVSNTAAATALNDTLQASLGGVSGPFTPGAAATGIAAQGSGQIAVGLNTATAGLYTQNGTVGFLSQNGDMADVSAGPDAAVQVKAQVNNLANADFDLLAGLGTLSSDGQGNYTLDLGLLDLGDSGLWTLQIDNDVAGPADLLRGLFDLASVDDFSLSGWGLVGDLAAGEAQGGLSIGFDADTLGVFEDQVLFEGFSFNASDPEGLAQLRSLRIRARVVDDGGNPVPEPGTLALLALALVLGRQASRRRRAA